MSYRKLMTRLNLWDVGKDRSVLLQILTFFKDNEKNYIEKKYIDPNHLEIYA